MVSSSEIKKQVKRHLEPVNFLVSYKWTRTRKSRKGMEVWRKNLQLPNIGETQFILDFPSGCQNASQVYISVKFLESDNPAVICKFFVYGLSVGQMSRFLLEFCAGFDDSVSALSVLSMRHMKVSSDTILDISLGYFFIIGKTLNKIGMGLDNVTYV